MAAPPACHGMHWGPGHPVEEDMNDSEEPQGQLELEEDNPVGDTAGPDPTTVAPPAPAPAPPSVPVVASGSMRVSPTAIRPPAIPYLAHLDETHDGAGHPDSLALIAPPSQVPPRSYLNSRPVPLASPPMATPPVATARPSLAPPRPTNQDLRTSPDSPRTVPSNGASGGATTPGAVRYTAPPTTHAMPPEPSNQSPGVATPAPASAPIRPAPPSQAPFPAAPPLPAPPTLGVSTPQAPPRSAPPVLPFSAPAVRTPPPPARTPVPRSHEGRPTGPSSPEPGPPVRRESPSRPHQNLILHRRPASAAFELLMLSIVIGAVVAGIVGGVTMAFFGHTFHSSSP